MILYKYKPSLATSVIHVYSVKRLTPKSKDILRSLGYTLTQDVRGFSNSHKTQIRGEYH